MSSAAVGTKIWLTPKRMERGPAAADAELKRWASTAFRPARLYGSVAAMREDALKSRQLGMGSAKLATEPRPWRPSLTDAVVAAGALVGGFLVGRWWVRRRKQTQKQFPVEGSGLSLLGAV